MDKRRMNLSRVEAGWLTRNLLVRREKGQAIVILALALGVLLTIAGLVYDVGMMRLQGAKMQRAADAASLAGVVFMPDNFFAGTNFGGNATELSLDTSQRNGFTNASGCSATNQPLDKVCVIPIKVSIDVQLKVRVTAPYTTTFMGLIGFKKIKVSREAIAEYSSPIQMGAPEAFLGTGKGQVPLGMIVPPLPGYIGDTSNPTFTGGDPERIEGNYRSTIRTQNFWLSLHWAGTDKAYGDPFVVKYNCNNNGGLCNNIGNDGATGVDPSLYQEDYDNNQPNTGYNFGIYMPPGSAAQLRVFDAAFAANPPTYNVNNPNAYDNASPTGANPPSDPVKSTWCASNSFFTGDNIAASSGLNQIDPLGSMSIQVTATPATLVAKNVANCRGTTASTNANVNGNYTSRSGAQQLNTYYKLYPPDSTPYYYGDDAVLAGSQWTVPAVPYTSTISGTNWNDYNRIFDPVSNLYHLKWVDYNTTGSVGSPIHPGGPAGGNLTNNGFAQWRLNLNTDRTAAYANGGRRVDVPGQNNFSLLLDGAGAAGVRVFALQRLPVYITLPSGRSDLYMANVPADAARKVMDVRLFDPGDVGAGNCTIQLLHPPDATHPTNYVQTGLNIVQGVQSDRNRAGESPVVLNNTDNYPAKVGTNQNGQNRWIDMVYRLEPTYTGGYWQVRYMVDTQATDRTTWLITLRGNPVHLVLPGQ